MLLTVLLLPPWDTTLSFLPLLLVPVVPLVPLVLVFVLRASAFLFATLRVILSAPPASRSGSGLSIRAWYISRKLGTEVNKTTA